LGLMSGSGGADAIGRSEAACETPGAIDSIPAV